MPNLWPGGGTVKNVNLGPVEFVPISNLGQMLLNAILAEVVD